MTTSNDCDRDVRVGIRSDAARINKNNSNDDIYNNNNNNNNNSNSNTMGSITPKPSAVFSTTSSFSALSDLIVINDDYNGDYSGEYNGDDRDCNDRDNRGDTNDTNAYSYSYSYSWKLRMVELFVVHTVLFVSMTVCFQATNRLTLTPMVTPTVTPTVTFPSGASSGSEATNTDSDSTNNNNSTDDCIYVPGGGFSGFWFSLGRLQSLQHPRDERFVCYSAGCLGVVSVLWNHFIDNRTATAAVADTTTKKKNQHERLYDNARSAQLEWQTGRMHRYRVVETFIDGLLDPLLETDESTSQAFLEIVRETVQVVTTVFGDDGERSNSNSNHNKRDAEPSLPWSSLIPRAKLQRPTDVASLKRLLLQTTWIPLATGSSLTHGGHMDGAFSMLQHPRCRKTVGLAPSAFAANAKTGASAASAAAAALPPSLYESFEKSAILWTNTLNVNLNKRDVERLWSTGLEYGA
uniref:Uncharacterized protein n=1 Tax=Pseudo-nitzschia australis TaxID=44445 RepID=A0A6U9YJ69_9STRA|mmetsp:Transcript_5951/g.13886  ORF Transcript_5951/g.13886 Transcript_5951/m.13886 type:complete len:464 (-) Transcript_5951:33-1424(-)|eukprot:CAMPEP_0168174666 /NCGR_PEP_ID=MMETSP0139_2-20121125/6647_1 /TAXON_ID=44445 /ORGANISM="Pseudo-nitzschia australis, Strain 10249 10 AB" /LENGTH=463 /DNA_ID=CAMNT_0008092875 /DNA_START=86 /DNA_END=1477 /DNA_ORIENTATION=+